jgi:hypothetical protein
MLLSGGYEGDTITQMEKALNEGLSILRKENEALKNRAAQDFPPIQAVESLSFTIKRLDDFRKSQDYYGRSTYFPLPQVKEKIEKYVQEEVARIEAVHKSNLPKIESNIKLVTRLQATMDGIGIARTHREEVPTRAQTRKYETREAGYQKDIRRLIRLGDNYEHALEQAKNFTSDINKEIAAIEAKEAAEKKKAEEEAKKVNKLKLIGAFQAKYNLPVTATVQEILGAIIKKDKYLYLAHYLNMNRNDWNDGPSYAENGLDSFDATTEEDLAIVEEIQSLISNWGGDGRVFRDCTHNYGYCFSKVDKTLKAEYDSFLETFSSELM